VTFPASTRRRSKTCRDPFAASSMTAQSRWSSTSLPPLMAHNRPAPPGCARGRARWQPNRVAAFQPNSAARPAQFSPPVKKLLQSLKNWRHRCGGMSVSGRWWSRRATPSIQRYSLLGPDFHRQDRTSFAWRTHSITSSASARSFAGMSRRSAFAVLRLMTNSNLVGCTTGRSAGFSPLKIRPT
jgi:hypothetical protein